MKPLSKILVLLFSLLPSFMAIANEDITGTWQGKLVVDSETEITLQFIISQDANGSYAAILNSPNQGAIKNVNASSVTYSADVLKLDVAELSGSYVGIVKNRLMEGAWTQEGTSFPLNMAPYEKRIITQEDIDAAIATANAFVALMDKDQRTDAYTFMGRDLKRMTSEEQFVEGFNVIRNQFGKVKFRNKLSSEYTDEMMGVKGGDHVEIVFETTFDKQEEPLIERVIMSDEDGEWKVTTHLFTPKEMYQEMQAQKVGGKEAGDRVDIMAIISSAEEVPIDQTEIDAALAAAHQFFENSNLPSPPMGEVESRKAKSVKGVHIEDLPNQPNGNYIKIVFETCFKENETAQFETVLLNNHNGNWTVTADLFGSPIGRGGNGDGAEFTD